MQVILTEDVESLGLAGQVVKVADGYARNKLIPSNLAVEASPGNLKHYEKKRAEYELRAMKEKERAEKLAAQIEDMSLIIEQKAGEKGKLYGSVTSMDLVDRLAEQGVDVDRRKIRLGDPIKSVGDYQVPIRLHPEVTVELTVVVTPAE
jgi:large subunit ribosomal protein L9